MVDTGANISVIPVSKVNRRYRRNNVSYKLFAANGSEIQTFGLITLELNLNLRRAYKWTFVIANVSQPIIGADFLNHFKLIVDISSKKLVDKVTNLHVKGPLINHNESMILSTFDSKNPCSDILSKYPSITKPFDFKEIPKHNVYHYIETTGSPVHAKARPLPAHRYDKVKEEFKHMQEVGICRPSKSEWASPLHVVPKKNGEIRPCGDYRRLNSITKPDRYPIPRIQDFTYGLAGKTVFSKIDVNRAFHNIAINPSDIEKTAIITPFGLFEFPRMTFGLCNAAQTYQRFMDNVVVKGIEQILCATNESNDKTGKSQLFCYIDDVIVASDSVELNKQHLDLLFQRFEQFGLTINVSKCEFAQESIEYLGYEVTAKGIRPLDDKVKAITEISRPKTVEQLRRFLGMVNFYRLHIPRAVDQQAELNKYLINSKKRDKTEIVWTDAAIKSFEQCKVSLKNAATLAYPLSEARLSLMTDASDTCIGAVLQQWNGRSWTPLGFYSKKLSDTQAKYSTYDRELLAIYMSVQYFRNQIEGRALSIFTDHKPLTFAFTKPVSDKDTPRRVRQLSYISEYSTDIQHITGSKNIVADTLSRIESIICPTILDFEEIARLQENDTQLASLLSRSDSNTHFKLKQCNVPNTNNKIYCEISSSNIRPYIPERFRRQAFDSIHNVSHPGVRLSRKLVAQKYFWPGINKDVGIWAKTCIGCQRSKISRHTNSELGIFQPSERFDHIHIDIVGPLPMTQEGYRYCITVIDRFTKWPEAFPVQTITAEVVAKVLYEGWICRFGSPKKITSDQGRQFESDLFTSLMKLLGVKKCRTTPYHPQGNGMIERWHRSLKAALMARLSSASWSTELSTVLLGLRAAIRSDSGISAAQLVYGQGIRLPGEFYTENSQVKPCVHTYLDKLRHTISQLRPKVSIHSNTKSVFVHPDLRTCTHVFIRNDAVRPPLTPPYDGPYEVVQKNEKVFTVQLPNRQSQVSIDRLKPAYLINSPTLGPTSDIHLGIPGKISNQNDSTSPGTPVQMKPRLSRSGRLIKRPVRFM